MHKILLVLLFLPNLVFAEVVIHYVHEDHLSGSNVITDKDGKLEEATDYLPYGKLRFDQAKNTFKEKHKFTGQVYDPDTTLTYMNARYYDAGSGQFRSEDPAFLSIGTPDLKKKTDFELEQYLSDPQQLNSYSYVKNNPLKYKDPTGEFWWVGFYDRSGYEGVSGLLMKVGEVNGGHARAMNAISRNQNNINELSKENGVDPKLTNAIVYEEQAHLMPDEVLGREQLFPNLGRGGVGVMQVTGPIGKEFGDYSKAELARDPRKNINAGTAYLSSIIQKNSSDPAIVGEKYNGSKLYGERIAAQINNPNYNANIIVLGLKKLLKNYGK